MNEPPPPPPPQANPRVAHPKLKIELEHVLEDQQTLEHPLPGGVSPDCAEDDLFADVVVPGNVQAQAHEERRQAAGGDQSGLGVQEFKFVWLVSISRTGPKTKV